jgi:hypothetical protein
MGFHLARRPTGDPTDNLIPVVTPREYSALLFSAIESVLQTPARTCDSYKRGVAHLVSGRPNSAVHAFSSFVRLYPDDPTGHRMLGLAHLAAGHFVAGFGHLVLAWKILRRDARSPGPLRKSVRLQLEAALVRLFLLPLYGRLGQRAAINRLMFESFPL